MLARDWYYTQRRRLGLDSAVASIYDRHDDSDVRARAALAMLGVQRGWRLADIGCGNGVLACEAALMGAEVDAIDISPAMLALANIQARDRKVAVRTQPAGLLSFAYQPNSYDLIVSEFTLHHLPDFWKAVALSRIFNALKPGANFYLRDIVFVSMPDGAERDVEGWDEFSPELMTTLRFAIAALPCLFVRKPNVSWPLLIAISFTLFLGQFLAQAFGIAGGVPVGLSSVIVQSQALFTIAFAAMLFNER